MKRLRWKGVAIAVIGTGLLLTIGPIALLLKAEELIRGKKWAAKR